MDEKITAWVTRGVLDNPIEKVQAELVTPKMIRYSSDGFTCQAWATEWHLTYELAVAYVEKRRAAKITSLEKQLAKLRALKIQVVDQTK